MTDRDHALEAAKKVYRRLLDQGRSDEEARRDAERWVKGNLGVDVELPKPARTCSACGQENALDGDRLGPECRATHVCRLVLGSCTICGIERSDPDINVDRSGTVTVNGVTYSVEDISVDLNSQDFINLAEELMREARERSPGRWTAHGPEPPDPGGRPPPPPEPPARTYRRRGMGARRRRRDPRQRRF